MCIRDSTPLNRKFRPDGIDYDFVTVEIDRAKRVATISIRATDAEPPKDMAGVAAQGSSFWLFQLARELDDAILDLRNNEFEIGTWVFKSSGDGAKVLAYDALLEANKTHWLANELRHFWKRVLKRIDVTSRSLVTQIEPGSCFSGTLAEIAFCLLYTSRCV